MLARNLLLAVSGAFTIFYLFLCLANFQVVSLTALGGQHMVPLGLLLFGGLSIGGLTGLSVTRIYRSRAGGEKRKLEWQAQDAKLAAEVKSDRESQLEAKIATLEVALKQALKRS